MTAAGSWVSGRLEPADAPVRLFCLAHAGGGAAFFWPWRRRLAPDVAVCPVVLPGRESRARETPLTHVRDLVEPLAEAVAEHADRPFALFGHSLGAVLAYETARRLTAAGRPPDRLLVSGRRAPHLPARRDPLHALPEPEFLGAVAAFGGTPPEVLRQPELLRHFVPVLRADFAVNETYEPLPGPPPGCPVSAYMGQDDTEVDAEQLASWRAATTGPFAMRVFAGGHFYLRGLPEPVRAAVLADVRPAAIPAARWPGERRSLR